ncbi:MAPEG family protein [Roseibium sediminicola]|uniref:MAPEG family protein n=1 Tax=Roseibium sediminicola TaxID=2933272 RepID=A0ABT0GTI7_9HYPH|nr:MAPEG family protein [Roseibium sp. CAU 1639]MCK7612754.1 MAPEG family protein [Roseibium sp. CAU 1639]
MTTWILAVLLLYLAQIYLSAVLFLPAESIWQHAGGRDVLPEKGKYAGRSDKALVNMKENLPFFLVPAVLAYVLPGTDMALAVTGAKVFFFGRLAYVPFYLSGIPGPRSLSYGVAFVGNVLMAWALLG